MNYGERYEDIVDNRSCLSFFHGHFVLSPVLLASRDQDGSHGKIGDCEQSAKPQTVYLGTLWLTDLSSRGSLEDGQPGPPLNSRSDLRTLRCFGVWRDNTFASSSSKKNVVSRGRDWELPVKEARFKVFLHKYFTSLKESRILLFT